MMMTTMMMMMMMIMMTMMRRRMRVMMWMRMNIAMAKAIFQNVSYWSNPGSVLFVDWLTILYIYILD